jgi:hypothetical protein
MVTDCVLSVSVSVGGGTYGANAVPNTPYLDQPAVVALPGAQVVPERLASSDPLPLTAFTLTTAASAWGRAGRQGRPPCGCAWPGRIRSAACTCVVAVVIRGGATQEYGRGKFPPVGGV